MSFDGDQVILTIDKLGIQRASSPKSGGWYSVLCPFHNDENLGSAFIHEESGGFKCFAGCDDSNIIKIVMHVNGCSRDEALEFIGVSDDYTYSEALYQRIKNKYNKIEAPKVTKRVKIYNSNQWNFELSDFNPNNFEYTKSRGYTKEFIDNYNIKMIKSGIYKKMDLSNRIFTPINSSKFGSIFEARKLYDEPGKEWIPKVIYPEVNPNVIIFNIENLNYDEDLYVTEGLAGIPKIWRFLSKNVTSIFGASLQQEQIEILRRFKKRIIFIPDRDQASFTMLDISRQVLENSYTLPVQYDDKDPEYETHIQEIEPILTTKYLLNHILNRG